MNQESTARPVKLPKFKKLFVWVSVSLALLIGSFIGVRTLLIESAVSDFRSAYSNQGFDSARQAIERLRGLDSAHPVIEVGLRDIAVAELEIRYFAAVEDDDLDKARSLLDEIILLEPKNLSKFDEMGKELDSLIDSKKAFEAGVSAWESRDFSSSISLLKSVVVADQLR